MCKVCLRAGTFKQSGFYTVPMLVSVGKCVRISGWHASFQKMVLFSRVPRANPFNLRHLLLSCDLLNIHKLYLNISLTKLVIHILKSFLQHYLFYTSSGNNLHLSFKLGLYLLSNELNASTAQRTWSVWNLSRKNDKQMLNAIHFIFHIEKFDYFLLKNNFILLPCANSNRTTFSKLVRFIISHFVAVL